MLFRSITLPNAQIANSKVVNETGGPHEKTRISINAGVAYGSDVDRVRGRGRPRQFDEEQVLDTLLELFWDEGFEAASMADIAEATGLNKSSLYNTFGSKDELFYRVLERYIDVRQRILAETLGAEGTLEVLGLFLDLMRMEIDGESGARGCLAVNSSTELGPRDDRIAGLSDRYRGVLASAMHSDGSMVDFICMPGGGTVHPPSQKMIDERLHYIRMKGNETFKMAVRSIEEVCREVLDTAGLSTGDVDWLVPHQAKIGRAHV